MIGSSGVSTAKLHFHMFFEHLIFSITFFIGEQSRRGYVYRKLHGTGLIFIFYPKEKSFFVFLWHQFEKWRILTLENHEILGNNQ